MTEGMFICASCGEISPIGDQKEALEELHEEFPGYTIDDCVAVCDDCYEKLMEQAEDDLSVN